MSDPIVIVGGGLAGQRCAETLRRCGCEEPIVMVCGETHRPYDRPPLSKEALSEAGVEDALSYRPREWYEQKAVRLSLGVAARRLHQRNREVELADGSRLRYARLLIATGASPRRLAMFEGFENVSALRTLEDAATLRRALVPGSRLLVIGAGFIGQEAASAAVRAGVHTTIVEAASSPLVSVLGTELSDWFARLHRESGVELLLGEQVIAPRADGRRVRAVTLAGGGTVACDHVLLGVGVKPDLDWLQGSSLRLSGVCTDPDGRTELPDVYAAGDAAAVFDPQLDAHVLGNHWESAGRQGSRAAKAMLGLDPGPPSISSFWSDLHGIRVQYLGRASLADEVSFDGDPASRRFTATFTRDREPVAVLLAGRPEALPQARAWLTGTTERTFA